MKQSEQLTISCSPKEEKLEGFLQFEGVGEGSLTYLIDLLGHKVFSKG
jgi:hypothetical protein